MWALYGFLFEQIYCKKKKLQQSGKFEHTIKTLDMITVLWLIFFKKTMYLLKIHA